MSQPNILLLQTDQQRFDTIAALGNTLIKTPALDRLCAEGVAFIRCYTPSPVCVPARAAMACGLPPHQTGIVDNGAPAGWQRPVSMMQRLSDLGYQTHGLGKMHFIPDSHARWGFETREYSEEGGHGDKDVYGTFVREQGFDHVEDPHGVRSEMYYVPQPSQLPERLHHTRWVGDRSLAFLHERDRGRPFFLWSSFIKPHPPFENPTPWNKLYRMPEMEPPFCPPGSEQLLTYWNHVQNRYKYYDSGNGDRLIRTIKAAYYACISYIDDQVGRILEALGEDMDNTLILFTSDHGEILGDYGAVGKRSMLDVAAQVPMLARWPKGLQGGVRCDVPTTLLDVMPTFLHAAGDANPAVCDEGRSLLDVANDPSADRVVYSQFQQAGFGLYMAASKTGKYIYSAPDQKEWYFDRAQGAAEYHNVIGNPMYQGDVVQLRSSLIERFRQDGYTAPLDGDGWKVFPKRELPDDPDAGLLFQDAPGLQERIDALGPGYRRRVTADPNTASRLLRPE